MKENTDMIDIRTQPFLLHKVDWSAVYRAFNQNGWAVISGAINAQACDDLIELYKHDELFRKHISMARWGLGRGQFRYFKYPLPNNIVQLRSSLYRALLPMANAWAQLAGAQTPFPEQHETFLAQCHQIGKTQPTIALYRYEANDYNGLHRDIYGPHAFLLQATILLSDPKTDFQGGEFFLAEQRPRIQTKIQIVPMHKKGDIVIYPHSRHFHLAVNGRPYHFDVSHGVAQVRSGTRYALGINFQDAQLEEKHSQHH